MKNCKGRDFRFVDQHTHSCIDAFRLYNCYFGSMKATSNGADPTELNMSLEGVGTVYDTIEMPTGFVYSLDGGNGFINGLIDAKLGVIENGYY